MAKLIVESNEILDPRIQKTSNILYREGKGLMVFRMVDAIVNGVSQLLIEVEINTDIETLKDAINRAGLKVIENAQKID